MSQASKLTGRSSASSSRLPGRCQGLAAARLVQHRLDRALGRERHAQVGVLEREAVDADLVAGLDATRGPERRGRVDRIADDLAAREPDRVDERLPRAGERVRARLDRGEIALGVGVHEADRRARQDVVELLQQEQLPQPVELGARVVAAQAREELGVVKGLLAAAVAPLRARL